LPVIVVCERKRIEWKKKTTQYTRKNEAQNLSIAMLRMNVNEFSNSTRFFQQGAAAERMLLLMMMKKKLFGR